MPRGRPSGPKVRCSGEWTESRYRQFIINNLRRATQKWKPIQDCLKEARVERGIYHCNGCHEEVPATIKDDKNKRVKNVFVDHIRPVIDPNIGFTTYDDFINGLFCERDNLQLLCKTCHDIKSQEEKELAATRRQEEFE